MGAKKVEGYVIRKLIFALVAVMMCGGMEGRSHRALAGFDPGGRGEGNLTNTVLKTGCWTYLFWSDRESA